MLVHLVETLLGKSGGFTENDCMPPGVLLDNMPNWEFGVLVQARDMTLAMRNDFSRSQKCKKRGGMGIYKFVQSIESDSFDVLIDF